MHVFSVRLLGLGCLVALMWPSPGLAREVAAPAPVVTHVEPNTAPTSGGTRITILGSDFDTSGAAPVRVFVGGQPCPEVTVHSRTKITAIVPPAETSGAVDVEVQNGDKQQSALKAALCYDDGKSWLATWYRVKARATSTWLLLAQGGPIMLLLMALSIFGVAWAIHCAFVIRPSQIMPTPFLDKLSAQISQAELQQAIDSCQKDGYLFGRVAVAALRKAGDVPHKIREVAQAAGSREASHLSQKISYLANIGVISPMLGLLGTVLGMIQAFKTIGMGEAYGKHILLAGAIHKAMVTTAAGLVIGIPAMACFYYFRGKLLRIVTDMEQVAEDVADAVSAAGEQE